MGKFVDQFNKDRGDLIYGLAGARDKYIREKLGWKDAPEDLPYVTIDQVNEHVPSLPGGDATDPVRHPAFVGHRAALERHAKYSPITLHPRTVQKKLDDRQRAEIDKHKSALQRETDYDVKDSHFDETPRQKRAFRRSSKFGIEYVIQQTQGHIHFVLDNIEKHKAANGTKSYTWGTIDMKEIVPVNDLQPRGSITGSELRYVYRNWSAIEPTKRLHFYLGGEEVLPPWAQEQWRDLWDQYRRHRDEKADRTVRQRAVGSPMIGNRGKTTNQ